jgi:MOSC domain-containing protein YiiM
MEEQTTMRVVSVNVGLPREVAWKDRQIATGIFKQPVAGQVAIRRLNLDGDRQADLSVHGGPEKAVYGYPSEHYPAWREELPGLELPWGQFGENLTTAGLREDQVQIGDCFRVGTAELVVTQPRVPCFKLGIRFGRPDILRRFLRSGRSGFYFSVRREGTVQAGDPISLVERATQSMTVAEINRLYTQPDADRELLRRAAQLEALPLGWRESFRERLIGSTDNAAQ